MARFPLCAVFYFVWILSACAQDNDDCECVPYYLCDNGTINTNGENIIDVRIKDDCHYLETCCKVKDVLPNPDVRSPPPPKQSGCGFRNPDGVGYRITGSTNNEAEFGEFPWTVAIMHKMENNVNHTFKCGGSLIHPQVVLTAAHCILGTKDLMVRAGEWDTLTTQERFRHQEKKVTSGVVHRGYESKTLRNDVALIFLDSRFNLSDHINVVCLPSAESVVLSDSCFVNGWGKDRFEKEGFYQNILKKIELPVVGREQCQNAFRKTRLGQHFKLDRTFMCAGGEEGKDACTGDGGGPLVCPVAGEEDNDKYQQVGIVAWGIGCGNKGVPGAYVDVAHFRDWIDEQMKKRQYDTNVYTL